MSESIFWGGTIRKLWATESGKFRDHLIRLDQENRRMRFGHSVSEVFLNDYAARTSDLSSLTYGFFVHGEIRAAAELRKLGDSWGADAEGAFSVEREWQDHGVGTELMGRVIRAARNRGVEHLYMSCLAENARMQRIAAKHGANLRFEYGEVIGDIMPTCPTYLSLFEEAFDDSRGFMLAVLDVQQKMVKAA